MSFFKNHSNWPLVPLKDIATLKRGYDLPTKSRIEGDVPIYAANGQNGSHNEVKKKGPGVITGRSGTIGKVHYTEQDYWPLNTALYVTDFHGNDPKWIYYLLKAFKLDRFVEGAGVPTLNRNLVHGELIPLPPLDEQKRIAAILDKADAIRQKRKQAIELADEFLRSVFLDMFGDPVTNPKGWEIKTIDDVTKKVTDGVHSKPHYVEEGIPFISVKNITTGVLSFEDTKFITKEAHEKYIKRCNPEYLDILYTKVGATYGRPAIVDVKKDFSLYVSVALIKPNHTLINPYFLKEVLATSALKRQADRSIKGAGVPDLHLVEIKSFLIPVPDMSIQDEFVNKTRNIRSKIVHLKNSLQCIDELNNSLAQKAFSGEL